MTRRRTVQGLALLLAIAAGAAFLWLRPLSVRGLAPESDVPLRVFGLGSVEARVLSRVGFETGAALAGLAVDAGDRVKQGQEIATLNSAVQEARLARARAALLANAASLSKADAALVRARAVLAQQQATNHRQQELARQHVVTPQRAEEAQRDETVARADLRVAEAELAVIHSQKTDAEAALRQETALLAQYRLVAPYDAMIVARHVEAGTVVKAGDTIFTLMDPTSLWIQAYIDEERAGQVALGQSATLRLRSRPHEQFRGKVVRIGLESDRVNEERRVWIACEDCPAEMVLGEQAEARILTGTRARALMVPEGAISGFDRHRGQVWLARGGRLARVELRFGARDDRGRVEVIEGLPEGATIVATSSGKLREGRAVRLEAQP